MTVTLSALPFILSAYQAPEDWKSLPALHFESLRRKNYRGAPDGHWQVEKTVVDHDEYFEYLTRRSRVGGVYREYWLYPRLVRRLRGKALDVGCGIGDMLMHREDTVGVDINPHTVAFCNSRGAKAVLMQPDKLPFANGEFDSVLMDNVLEHIADPERLLSEVRRVLRPQGRLLVGVPGVRGWASDADHKIPYDAGALTARMEAAEFKPLESFYTPLWRSAWLDRHLRQYCLYGLFVRT